MALGTGEAVRLRGKMVPSISFEPDFRGEGRSTQSKVCRLGCEVGRGGGVTLRDLKAFLGDDKGFSFTPVIDVEPVRKSTTRCIVGERITVGT